MPDKTFATRLRAARKAAGLSQHQLAIEVGCTAAHIGHIEQGTTPGSVELLQKIAARLGLTTDWLLTGKGRRSVSRGCRK